MHVFRVLRGVAVAAVVTAGGLVLTSTPAWAAPALTVTPDTDLVDKQPVDVDGTGYTPGASIAVLQCETGATSASGCDTSGLDFTTADGTGAFSHTYTVRRIITTESGDVDCAVADACRLVAANSSSTTEAAAVPISFDPTVPPFEDLEVDVTLDPTGTVVAKTGVVTLTGTITCNRTADAFVDGFVRQRAGRTFIDGEVFAEVACGPTPTTWTASGSGFNGIFKGGSAQVDLFAFAFDGDEEAFGETFGTVKLRGKKA